MRHERLFSVHFGYCLQAATCDQFRCLPPYIKWRYLASLSQQRKPRSKKCSSLKLLWIMNRYLKLVSMFDIVGRLPSLQAMYWYQLTFGMSKYIVGADVNCCVTLLCETWCVTKCEDTSRWRHQMETFSALLGICAENSPITGEFPIQRPVTRSFDGFFDLHPTKRLS